MERLGYNWKRVKSRAIRSLASGDMSDPYYRKSYGDRKIFRGLEQPGDQAVISIVIPTIEGGSTGWRKR